MGEHKTNPVAAAVAAGLEIKKDEPPVSGAQRGLQIQIGVENDLVCIRFDQAVAFLAMPAAEAANFSKAILANALQAQRMIDAKGGKLILPPNLRV